MKKILIFLFMFLIIPITANADTIYNIDMKVDIQKDGSAKIVETWEVQATEGTEWNKKITDAGELSISDYKVLMDGKELEEVTWNPNGTLEENAGKYGIKYTNEGFELCFGKQDMNKHTFTLNYTLSEFVFNTADGQVLYFTLLPRNSAQDFKVTIKSEIELSDDLEISGYGYNGYIDINDGVIEMTNDGSLENEYVVLLTKFDSNTFSTENSKEEYKTYEDISNDVQINHPVQAKEGHKSSISSNLIKVLIVILTIVALGGVVLYYLIKTKKIDLKKLKNNK